ncbi:MAG: cysteine desulfurase family protein [Kordiimonas sp.]
MKQPVYLDYQATTPLDKRVLDEMMPFFSEKFGNPHSSTHAFGWETDAAIDVAREKVANVISAQPEEIIFLSGATEANNLVIKGVMDVWGKKKPHLVTVATEHKCVLEAAYYCQRLGYNLTVLPVNTEGMIDLEQLEKVVTEQTALVSIMAVNNEIGVIQPMKDIGKIVKAAGALLHTDAAQAYGKIGLDVDDMAIDFMSISGHKVYGPKGVGALYKRAGRHTALTPQMSGGGQERGLRSGTQAPALVVGLGVAAEISHSEMGQEQGRLAKMADRFVSKLSKDLPGLVLNGSGKKRWSGNINLSFPGIDGDLLVSSVRNLAVSSGAACASAVSGPSYVLEAIGVSETNAKSSLRIGIGRFTTDEELDFAADELVTAINALGGLKA